MGAPRSRVQRRCPLRKPCLTGGPCPVAEEALAEIEEAEEETAEPAELTASDLLAEAETDAAAVQGIPEPSVERWDAEGRFGAAGRPELQQHRSGASLFGRVWRAPFRLGS